MANDYAATERPTAAIEHYRQAVKLKPNYAQAHNNLGNLLRSQGQLDDAIRHFRRALEVEPASSERHGNLGIALIEQGKLIDAIDAFQQAVNLDSGSAAAHSNLGNALGMTGNRDQALSHLRKASNLRPDWAQALNGLAWALATHPDALPGDIKEAIQCAEKAATTTNHQDANILDILAATYAAGGQFEKAMDIAKAAIEIATNGKRDAQVDDIRNRLDLYRDSQPYLELTGAPSP